MMTQNDFLIKADKSFVCFQQCIDCFTVGCLSFHTDQLLPTCHEETIFIGGYHSKMIEFNMEGQF